MAVARHGTGVGGAITALASQVHPVFMLPPVAVSAFGALLAGRGLLDLSIPILLVHALAIFAAVYTAHVKDGYVDFYVRGEDEEHPLTAAGCRLALLGATATFLASLLALWTLANPGAVLLTIPGWLLGYFHAPQLDTNPVSTTTGYPLGIALALLGAFYAQTGTLTALPLSFALVFLIVLSGVKVIDDAQDFDYDRSIDKRTVAVRLGMDRARRLGYGFMATGLLLVTALAAVGLFPTGAVLAVFAFAAVAAVAHRADPTTATMLLVRGAYVFLALLLVAVWYEPLSGPPPVDITILGPYTYLATEVVFGAIALALLYRARALRSAAVTIALVYPIAYVWDWYTLTVGVFSIPLRTGIDLLGIPLEEHLFMIVVPAFVLAIHETRRASQTLGPTSEDS